MKKVSVANIILLSVFIFSVISFSLVIKTCIDYWDSYHLFAVELPNSSPQDAEIYKIVAEQNLSHALQTTFALVFSALSAVAAVVGFILVNPKFFRKRRICEINQQAELNELKKDGE